MTKTLFALTCLAALLAAITAALIRGELAQPGVSPLFLTADGTPNERFFTEISISHALFCYLSVILLGTTLCAAARLKSAPLAGVWVAVGSAISLIAITLMVLSHLSSAAPIENGVGWVLYPPLSQSETSSALTTLANWLPDAIAWRIFDLPAQLILPALAMLYLGIYAMLSTLPALRLVGYIGPALVALVTLVILPFLMTTSLPFGTIAFGLLTLPVVVCAAIGLRTQRPAWLVMIAVGALTTLGAQVAILFTPPIPFASGTVLTAALGYVLPLGLAWFALPALILFTKTTRPTVALRNGAIIAVTLSLWLIPMMRLGFIGQPMRYVDYPTVFAALNLVVSSAVFAFMAIYASILWRLRTARA